mgnify:CR=1 FL=1
MARDSRYRAAIWNPGHAPVRGASARLAVSSLSAVFEQIDTWQDTRDFRFMDLHWMLALGQGDTPMTQLSPEVIAAIDERMSYAVRAQIHDRGALLFTSDTHHPVLTRGAG